MSDLSGSTAIKITRDLLREACLKSIQIRTETEWTDLVEKAGNCEWVFLISWSSQPALFCWGTTAAEGKRLRFSGALNPNIIGTYEYRVDFFMLKKIFGPPTIEIFQYDRNSEQKAELIKRRMGVTHPWYGINAKEAGDITKVVYANFQKTKHWLGLDDKVRSRFQQYMTDVYFAKRVHPRNPKRHYHYSDSLDFDFLNTIGLDDLTTSIETALECKFQRRKFKIKNIDPNAAAPESAKDLNEVLSEIENCAPEHLIAGLKRN